MPYSQESNPIKKRCWPGYSAVPGMKASEKGSCRKNSPAKKVKGGGTKKVCLPASKVRNMSASERSKVTSAKRKAAKGGGYKRSSKSNVKGARKPGATLRDWFKKENWVQVGNPKKKCGEK
tara:strand:- start:291 stop:653 length:363 start_codon:yes stop_codon:yes gene_type:complete